MRPARPKRLFFLLILIIVLPIVGIGVSYAQFRGVGFFLSTIVTTLHTSFFASASPPPSSSSPPPRAAVPRHPHPVSRAYAQVMDDRTLSPYFEVRSRTDDGMDVLPLGSTSVRVDIAGVIADVKVTQAYKNAGTQPLEAIYVFPGSTRAAVYGMKMTIGERVQVAKVQERRQAQQTYQKAKASGKSAALLEQHRPNVFQMHVANILPGDTITVELAYTELLTPTDGLYTLAYPTVVGPRYRNQSAQQASAHEHWVANPYLTARALPPYAFDLQVNLAAGLPIQEITSTSHEVDIAYNGKAQAAITLAETETTGGNRDYILKYRLQGGQIESGLLLYEGEEENFFLLMMQPPQRVALAQIPPREYVFIVDVSGSMHGFPLATSKKLLKSLLAELRQEDTFNVLLFAGTSSLFAERSLPATPDNIARAIQHIDRQQGGGGTELLTALERALQLPQAAHTARTFVIATDGYVTVETATFDLVRENLHRANLFAFGIGSAVNRFLIEGLARAGQGEPFVVTEAAEAPMIAARFRHYIQAPTLTDIHIDYGDFEVYDIEPRRLPDLFAERPVVVFGKWRGTPQGTIALQGAQGEQSYAQTIDVSPMSPMPNYAALRYLWARDRIATLGDYNTVHPDDGRIEQITQLGLQYNLLTAYTSFVAVDDRVRPQAGQAQTVRQPLPLPKGVSKHAVGGQVPTTPEPETYLLMLVLGAMLLWTLYRRRQALGAAYDRLRSGKASQ